MKKLSMSNMNLYMLYDGSFWLDGGSIFGIIPKVFWEKLVTVDHANRIEMPVYNLLIETEKHKILVDTGVGNKLTDKKRRIYNLSTETPNTKNELKKCGFSPNDIDIVILTHMHFDHAGGIISQYEDQYFFSYPNAVYYIQQAEWDAANFVNERTKGSYTKKDFKALTDSERLKLIDGNYPLTKEISLMHTPGHTQGMQIVNMHTEKGKVYFVGDLIPNHHFLVPVYLSGFDLYPLYTLKFKKEILETVVKTESILLFQHDTECLGALIERSEKGYQIKEKVL